VELYGGVWYTDYMVEDGRGNLEKCLRDMKEYNIKIGTAFLLVLPRSLNITAFACLNDPLLRCHQSL